MSKIKLLNNQGDEVTIEHSDTSSKQGNSVVNIKDVTKQVGTIADLKLLDGSHKLVYVTGYHTKGDGAFGSHFFEWDATSTEDDNGGTIIKLNSVATGRYKLKYDGAVNVRWFGAIGDGVTDDSSSIQKAFDSEADEIVFVNTSKYYKAKDLVLLYGKTIRGVGRKRIYNPYSASDMEGSCCVVYDTTGTSFIKFGGSNTVRDINFYGSDNSVPMYANSSGGSCKFFNISSCKFSVGIGNITTYCHVAWVINCHTAQNTIGIGGFVDSHVHGCEINANTDGVYQPAGANDTQFIDNKVEWNTRYGYNFYSVSNNSIISGICDRNYTDGLRIIATKLTITGGVYRRNGKTNTSGSHFYIENGKLLVSNIVTAIGADDNGGGNTTPAYVFHIGGNTSNTELNISNSDLTGYTTSVANTYGNKPKFYGNKGFTSTTVEQLGSVAGIISTGGTTSVTGTVSTGLIVGKYNVGGVIKFGVKVRNSSTGHKYYAEFAVHIGREGGDAAAYGIYKILGDTTIETSGSDYVDVSVSNVNIDGSQFDLTLTATSSNNLQSYAIVWKGEM